MVIDNDDDNSSILSVRLVIDFQILTGTCLVTPDIIASVHEM